MHSDLRTPMSTTDPNPKIETPPQNNVTNNSLLEIHPVNFLSFGPDTQPIPLKQLNVLIGANGSGKSNLLEAIDFMRATPGDLGKFIRAGGGTSEWIWKGDPNGIASILTVFQNQNAKIKVGHNFGFSFDGSSFNIYHESIDRWSPGESSWSKTRTYEYPAKTGLMSPYFSLTRGVLDPTNIDRNKSILGQLRDPTSYPDFSRLVNFYEQISIYRDWSFGSRNPLKVTQQTGLGSERLNETFDNLALFLTKFSTDILARNTLKEGLRKFYDGFEDFVIVPEGLSLRLFFQENGMNTQGIRLSDGTVRYLCLLALLSDPKPPPVICIEEPELGLHPDVISVLAKLLLQASERTQLIITTHSDVLIDALSEHPEYVLVCEKDHGQTQITRLDPDELKVWLDKYKSLGDLWTRGHLGGNRW
jgi:predicted ATPase